MITTHILDTSKGKPAAGITIILSSEQAGAWKEIAKGVTNNDGRIPGLLANDTTLSAGTYKMRFETKEYFDTNNIQTFYPFVEIVFNISSSEYYHIPLLLNPFGYSTYRGS